MASSSHHVAMPFYSHPSRYGQLKEENEVCELAADPAPVNSTVVHMLPPQVYVATPVRDHLPWSLFTTIYFNFCCLGFMALVFSVKARDRKLVGDQSGASSYGSTSKCLNITALLLSLLSLIVFLILLFSGIFAFRH